MISSFVLKRRVASIGPTLVSDPTVRMHASLGEVEEGGSFTLYVTMRSLLFGVAQVNWSISESPNSIVSPTSGTFNFTSSGDPRQELVLTTKTDPALPGVRNVKIKLSNPIGCAIEAFSEELTIAVLGSSGAPIMSVVPLASQVDEGGTALFEISRNKNGTDSTVAWFAAAPAGAISGDVSGNVTMSGEDLISVVSVPTIDQAGDQGVRQINFALGVVTNCQLNPTANRAQLNIVDRDPNAKWWLNGARRSGFTDWNGGAANIVSIDALKKFERDVHYLDAIAGPCDGGKRKTRVLTWNLLAGGDPATPNTVQAGSQLDWSSSSGPFSAGFNYCPPGTFLIFHFDTLPVSHASWLVSDIWTRVAAGEFDAYYTAAGKRMRRNVLREGHRLDRLIVTPNYAFNTPKHYQVFSGPTARFASMIDQRAVYKMAMQRIVDKIRTGAEYDLKFAFAPAIKFAADEDLGAFESFYAGKYGVLEKDTFDVIDLAGTIGANVIDFTTFGKLLDGTLDMLSYGLVSDQIAWATSEGRAIAYSGWRPKFEASDRNLVPDQVYAWMRAHFNGYKAILAYECVDGLQSILASDVYGTGWPAAVAAYKTQFSGSKAT